MSLDAIQFQEFIRVRNSTHLTVLTIVALEFFFTLPGEMSYVWAKKKTAVFYLFLMLKYSTLLVGILNVVTDVISFRTAKECYSAVVVLNFASFIGDVFITGAFTLRCYAIWERSFKVGLAIGLTFAAYITVDAIASFGPSTAYVKAGQGGCIVADGLLAEALNPIRRYILAAFDTLVLFTTVTRTARLSWDLRKLHMKRGLSYYILRDGLLYFIFIDALVVTLVSLEIWREHYAAVSWKIQTTIHVLEQCQPPLSALAVQRLVLNLHQVADEQASPDQISRYLGQLDFAHGSVLGNIGAPLSIGEDNLDESDMPGYTSSSADAEEAEMHSAGTMTPDV